jgi:hypothetical protein
MADYIYILSFAAVLIPTDWVWPYHAEFSSIFHRLSSVISLYMPSNLNGIGRFVFCISVLHVEIN